MSFAVSFKLELRFSQDSQGGEWGGELNDVSGCGSVFFGLITMMIDDRY